MVSGDVKNPGRISILDGVRSVVDAINRAGGLATSSAGNSFNSPPTNSPSTGSAAAASQSEVVVRRQGQVILQEQYSDLLAGDDIGIQKDDEIVVRPNSRSLTVLGAVRISGNVPMTKQNITLVEALGQVGGLADERANKTGVFVFRMGDIQASPTARARIFRLDLSDPASMFVAQQFGMQTRDVVYVTNAPLYEYNKVLSSMYLTFAAIGVAKGTIIPATVF
jgi:polysaccharide export outer membrane protein